MYIVRPNLEYAGAVLDVCRFSSLRNHSVNLTVSMCKRTKFKDASGRTVIFWCMQNVFLQCFVMHKKD